MRRSWNLALLAAGLLGAAAPARAGLLPVSATTAPDGTNTRFTYGIELTSDSTLKSGDYFTLFDFPKMVPGSAVMPAGWTLSTNAKGGNPGGTIPGDDPNVPNLTFTYHGPDIVGQVGLGNFAVDATSSTTKQELYSFTGLTQRQVDGVNESNITSTLEPKDDPSTGGGGGGPGVPEPCTLLLLGIGLPLAGAARYVRSRRQPAVC
jgi:hypothetical protein